MTPMEEIAKLADVPVGSNAHTVCVNPLNHEVYLPLKPATGGPVLRIMTPGK